MSASPTYLTTEEAAHVLRCSPAVIRALIKSGRLPATRVRHRWLIEHDALTSLLATSPCPAKASLPPLSAPRSARP